MKNCHPVTQKLLAYMEEKRSNLCVSADLTQASQVISLAKECAEHMVMLKTHVDILEDFSQDFIDELVGLSEEKKFLIFEDRKFADIGNTVKYQYGSGIYRIANWAHITNAHIVPGPGIIEGLKAVGLPKGRALLLLAEMSSKGNMAKDAYTKKCIALAKEHSDFVIGFISMGKLTDGMLHMTPGVQKSKGGDPLGQQYNTPENVIAKQGSDIIIVGRGIYGAKNPAKEAKWFQEAGWQAYKQRQH